MIRGLRQWVSGVASPVSAEGPGTPRQRVLMVCTGNICRSPAAEGVLRTKLLQAGLQGQVRVDSAGTQGYHTSEAPDARAVRSAAQRGYDIAKLRARPMRAEDFVEFDWLLAMDQGHLDWLRKRAPAGFAGQICLIMDFARRHPGVSEVPDPYFGGPAGFEHVLDLLEDACEGVLDRLAAERPPAAGG